MAKDIFSNHKLNTAIIVLLVLIFVAVIWFPKTIWDTEAELRDESRFRMNAITQAEKLYYQLSRQYTTDLDRLENVLNGILDSVEVAANDTLLTYAGYKDIAFPADSVMVNYDDDYIQAYLEQHKTLAQELTPHLYLEPEQIHFLLDTLKELYSQGDFLGEQEIEIDSTRISLDMPERFNIMHQNIKTLMFNALTGSFTKHPEFANPLVDAVLDSIASTPSLGGRIPFDSLYSDPIPFEFIIPFNFSEQVEKTRLAYKEHLIIDSIDSASFGDTLYTMALDTFLMLDTAEVMPESFTMIYTDTSDYEHEIAVDVKVENMMGAQNERRNKLYLALTGYNEPSPDVANMIIDIAFDSLAANPNIADSIHVDLDLSGAVFTVNIHRNIPDFHNKISRENAYFKTSANLSEMDWDAASDQIVEFVADTLQGKRPEFKGWQVVNVEAGDFYVNVPENFMRHYDDMNIRLYEQLAGTYNNVHTHTNFVVREAARLAAIDTLDFTGEQQIQLAADTLRVFVFDEYATLYDSTFVIFRDTVVQVDDSTFTGVWDRGNLLASEVVDWDSLGFIKSINGGMAYDAYLADSVRDMNIREKADTSLVEKVFYGMDQFVVTFNRDSLAESIYRLVDAFAEDGDSIVVDTLNRISPEFVVGPQEKDFLAKKDSFGGWLDTLIAKKYTKIQLVDSYYFDPKFKYCTVTGIPFRVTIRNNVNLTVESPIEKPIRSRRYGFFTQVDSTHGRIVDGEPSWADE